MPSLANITVKKNDGTTDIVYTGVQPSSGDATAAVWQSQTVGTAISHRPELHLVARSADGSRKRALRTTFLYPQIATNTTTGVTSVVERLMASTNWTIPRDMTAADVNEAVAQYANLLASTLIKQCVQSQYSAS